MIPGKLVRRWFIERAPFEGRVQRATTQHHIKETQEEDLQHNYTNGTWIRILNINYCK
jgi:hypothetical protein